MNIIMLEPGNEFRIEGDWFIVSNDFSVLAFTVLPIVLIGMKFCLTLVIMIQAPTFAKRSATMLLVGSTIGLAASVLIAYVPEEIIVFMDACFMIILTIVIFRHPGIFSFVPYKAEYLVLLTKRGDLAFEFRWRRGGKHRVDQTTQQSAVDDGKKDVLVTVIRKFAGVTLGALPSDVLTEFETDHGVYMVYLGSKHFMAGLFAMRSSQSLREGFKLFTSQVDAIHEGSGLVNGQGFKHDVETLIETQMLGTQAPRMAYF